MEVFYRPSNTFTVKLDVTDVEDMIKKVGPVQEIFDAASKCGKCGCENTRFNNRKADGHDVYEIGCTNVKCRAKLHIGKDKATDSLFPRRYPIMLDAKGKWVPEVDGDGKRIYYKDDGWVVWDKEQGKYV